MGVNSRLNAYSNKYGNPGFLMLSRPDNQVLEIKSEIRSLGSVPIPRSVLPGISLRTFISCKKNIYIDIPLFHDL